MKTITIDNQLEERLKKFCYRAEKDVDDFVTESINRQLDLEEFDRLQQSAIDIAKKAGCESEEDVMNLALSDRKERRNTNQ